MKGTRVIYYMFYSKLLDIDLRDRNFCQNFLKTKNNVLLVGHP